MQSPTSTLDRLGIDLRIRALPAAAFVLAWACATAVLVVAGLG